MVLTDAAALSRRDPKLFRRVHRYLAVSHDLTDLTDLARYAEEALAHLPHPPNVGYQSTFTEYLGYQRNEVVTLIFCGQDRRLNQHATRCVQHTMCLARWPRVRLSTWATTTTTRGIYSAPEVRRAGLSLDAALEVVGRESW